MKWFSNVIWSHAWQPDYFWKMCLPPTCQSCVEILKLLKDLVIKFFCIWYIMIWYIMIQFGILYYLLYSWTNPIPVENLVPEMWPKMFWANQIAGFKINYSISLNQHDDRAWFFPCLYKFKERNWVGPVKNGCG